MNARLLALALLTANFAATAFAADEEAEKKPTPKETRRAQMIEDAKKQAATAKPAATTPPPAKSAPAAAQSEPAPVAPATATAPDATPAKAPAEPATILPKVEVNRGKVSPLARELYETEKELAREKQLTKPTELDKALNSPKVTLPLFGGQSTAARTSIASERTSLLQAEADLIEEIAHAKTKEQKAELRKQLDELKKMRRELEQAVR